MPTLVLVDGSSYLYRAFHALPDLRTSRGEPTGALRGVLSMLRRLVEDGKPDYFAVVFDAPGKTFRDDWYPRVQGQSHRDARRPRAADRSRCTSWCARMAGRCSWSKASKPTTSSARSRTQARAAGIDTIISTADKDLAQLVAPRVKLVNTMSNETLDEAGVLAKFGVRADQVLDLLTLTGDAVDNIPGVPKVGPKTAAKWLAQYGTLDSADRQDAAEIGGVVGDNLRADARLAAAGQAPAHRAHRLRAAVRRTAISRSRRATTRSCASSTSASSSRAGSRTWRRRRRARCRRRDRRQSARATPPAAASTSSPRRRPAHRLRTESITRWCSTRRSWQRWLDEIERADLVSFDIETTVLEPLQARIVGAVVRDRAGSRLLHPARHRYTGAPEQLDRATIARAARAVARRSGTAQARPERQVRPARAGQPRHRRSRAWRTTRCSSRTCSSRTSRTTWTTSRGGISTSRRSRTTT